MTEYSVLVVLLGEPRERRPGGDRGGLVVVLMLRFCVVS